LYVDRKEYVFRSFWDRDECYKLLTNFISKFGGKTSKEVARPISTIKDKVESKEDRRSNSSHISNSSFNASSNITNNSFDIPINPIKLPSVTISTSTTSSSPTLVPSTSSSTIIDSNNRSIDNKVINIDNKSIDTNIEDNNIEDNNIEDNNEDIEEDVEEDTESGIKEASCGPSSSDYAMCFQEAVHQSKLRISVISETLSINVEDFINLFIDENATKSWKSYHESVGDIDVVSTTWSENVANIGCSREIKFLKPVNLPGLKSTRASKIQRCRRFGSYGAILTSSTRLEDVPAAGNIYIIIILLLLLFNL
jgi:hypothetical protein